MKLIKHQIYMSNETLQAWLIFRNLAEKDLRQNVHSHYRLHKNLRKTTKAYKLFNKGIGVCAVIFEDEGDKANNDKYNKSS